MTNIDEFESLFKAADKPVFQYSTIALNRIAVVLDVDEETGREYLHWFSHWIESATGEAKSTIEIKLVTGDQFSNCGQLLDILKGLDADAVCTYRNLHGHGGEFPYSLGEFVDVLTQVSSVPVLLLPRFDELDSSSSTGLNRVMLMTDHLAGDNRLVSYAARFAKTDGELILTHVEDQQTFDRYMGIIGKIPDIETDLAKIEIMDRLLKEPADFIQSCMDGLMQMGLPLSAKAVVTSGHHLADYKNLILDHEIDLLVMNTKDEDQLAMHGLAYPLAVELRQVPMLLI